jgi:phosphoribosylglycinamide formyltransferase-1
MPSIGAVRYGSFVQEFNAHQMNIAVLASGEGTTLQAVLDACAGGRLPARVVIVISNNAGAGALRRARDAGVPVRHLSAASVGDPARLDLAIRDALIEAAADWVLLAGYMKKLGRETLLAFAGRIINTHPALLPEFGGRGMYGMNVHRAVLAAGRRLSGASVHWVDEHYDTGALIEQVRVPVEAADSPQSLAARVQAAERELVVEVLQSAAAGRLKPPAPRGPGATS